jgi:hypothetical protein
VQSAFGSVTSQSFGFELGLTVASGFQVFVDAGRVRDAAATELGASAQAVAVFLGQTQTGVALHVKEPVSFAVAGVKYSDSPNGLQLIAYATTVVAIGVLMQLVGGRSRARIGAAAAQS